MQKMSMVKIPAKRRAGILEILTEYDNFHSVNPGRNMPLDLYLRYHFLKHKNEFDADARIINNYNEIKQE